MFATDLHAALPDSEPIGTRFRSFQEMLLAIYRSGTSLPSVTKGSEREIFINNFLKEIFPNPYRFGQGAVIDHNGNLSGGLDAVIERPFGPSYSFPGADQRLYIADTVAAVLEVKSNLSNQWEQAKRTCAKLNKISYRPIKTGMSQGQVPDHIPIFVVGFVGGGGSENLAERVLKTPASERPTGALSIDTGAFFYNYKDTFIIGENITGLYFFVNILNELLIQVLSNSPDWPSYLKSIRP